MVLKEKKNIKEWVENKYSTEVFSNLTDLYLSSEDVEGLLSLKWEEFPKLERVWVHHKLRIITGFDLEIARLLEQKKAPEGIFLEVENGVEVLKYVPIEEKMEELFPDEDEKKTITELDLTQKGLRGTLELSEFKALEELTVNMDCPWNRKSVNSNFITGLNLPNSLTKLTLINNPNDWKIGRLSNLTNLEELNLSGDSKYPAQWDGSLKDVEGLENLTKLNISYNPNIKLGLESIKNLEEVEVKGTIYEKALKSFNGDVRAWKVVVYPKAFSVDKTERGKAIDEYINSSRGYLKFLNEKGYTDRDLENKIELLLDANSRGEI